MRRLSTASLARAWPHVVAAFVVFHLVACVLDALPNPSAGMDRRNWKEPRVQLELAAWSTRLGVDKATLEERMWQLSQAWLGLRKTILAPVRPYLDVTGVRQNWTMFVAGSRYRDQFQIRGRACPEESTECDWRTLYALGSKDATFLREHLEYPRIRSSVFRWVWADHRKRFQRSCRVLAERAFDAFPTLEMVECRFERSMAPPHRAEARPLPPPTWQRPVKVTRRDTQRKTPS